jgi:hypothetical protein
MHYPGFGLHPAQRIGQSLCELPVAHIRDLASRYRFTVGDVNPAGRKYLLTPRPTFKGAVNQYRYNRRVSTPAQKAKARLKRRNSPVNRTRTLRKNTNPPAFFEFADDLPHRRQIRLALLDRYGIDRRNQPAEKPVFPQRITGKKIQRPFQTYSAKYRVKIALVVTDQHKSAFIGDIFPPANMYPKK